MPGNARKHGVRYPWDDWFALGSFRLVRGQHFAGAPHGMVQTARVAADRRGIRIHVAVQDETLTINVVRE